MPNGKFFTDRSGRKERPTMQGNNRRRGGFLKWFAAVLLGATMFTVVAQPAEAARFRGRGWGWGGYRAYRMPFRGYYRAYPRYGYGYRKVAPRFYYGGAYPYGYSSGYGGYYSAPMRPGFGYYNYVPPML
jgi:hypothetical protein